jgi:hypothetical protein
MQLGREKNKEKESERKEEKERYKIDIRKIYEGKN